MRSRVVLGFGVTLGVCSVYYAALTVARNDPGAGGPSPLSALSVAREHGHSLSAKACFRLCDGYFYPISVPPSGGALDDDMLTCHADCSERLALIFHAPLGSSTNSVQRREFAFGTGRMQSRAEFSFDGIVIRPLSYETQTEILVDRLAFIGDVEMFTAVSEANTDLARAAIPDQIHQTESAAPVVAEVALQTGDRNPGDRLPAVVAAEAFDETNAGTATVTTAIPAALAPALSQPAGRRPSTANRRVMRVAETPTPQTMLRLGRPSPMAAGARPDRRDALQARETAPAAQAPKSDWQRRLFFRED
ncbi:MAG: hypothetical protein ACFCUN_08570 [Hyphomicrobiaceae bacterium]